MEVFIKKISSVFLLLVFLILSPSCTNKGSHKFENYDKKCCNEIVYPLLEPNCSDHKYFGCNVEGEGYKILKYEVKEKTTLCVFSKKDTNIFSLQVSVDEKWILINGDPKKNESTDKYYCSPTLLSIEKFREVRIPRALIGKYIYQVSLTSNPELLLQFISSVSPKASTKKTIENFYIYGGNLSKSLNCSTCPFNNKPIKAHNYKISTDYSKLLFIFKSKKTSESDLYLCQLNSGENHVIKEFGTCNYKFGFDQDLPYIIINKEKCLFKNGKWIETISKNAEKSEQQ